MVEKHYKITCMHTEDKKDCLNLSNCVIHCHNNKNERCRIHCGRSWETITEAEANAIKHTHIAEHLLHKPIVEKI